VFVAQVRAARGLLGWSQTRLAKEAGISRPTVARLEMGQAGEVDMSGTIEAIRDALDRAGVMLLDPDRSGGHGVRLKHMKRAG
jgi:transcriptional regulator with XRE-family HTH domain